MADSKPRTRPCRPIERRPPTLKDFLLRDDAHSCSSTGFKSFPRHPPQQPPDRRPAPPGLQRSRSRSRAAADATISAFHKLLNAVRSLPLPAVKSPSKKKKDVETVVQVRVKDILRWKSFRDLMIDGREEPQFRPGSDGEAGHTCRAVSGEIGFSAEELCETGNDGGDDPMWTGAGAAVCSDMGPTKQQELATMDDEEQHSPVSVLDSPFQDDHEDPLSSFDQTLANVERTRTRILQRIKWFEGLAGVDPIDLDEPFSDEEDKDHQEDEDSKSGVDHSRATHIGEAGYSKGQDFSMDELETKPSNCRNDIEKLEEAEAYLSSRGVMGMLDMEKEVQWSKFEEQQNQMGVELEIGMLNALLDELLFELVGGSDKDCETGMSLYSPVHLAGYYLR